MSQTRDVFEAMAVGADGVLAVGLVGMDGTTIDVLKYDPGFPFDALQQEVVTAVKVLLYMSRKADAGPLDYVLVSYGRFVVLIAAADPDHCVAMFLHGRANLGKARMQLRRYLPEITQVVARTIS